jgi:hypothetical protein
VTAKYADVPAYPRCGWEQEIHGPGSRCLMVGVVDVELRGGLTATLCTVHAHQFEKRPWLGLRRTAWGQAPNQIEAE